MTIMVQNNIQKLLNLQQGLLKLCENLISQLVVLCYMSDEGWISVCVEYTRKGFVH